MLSKTIGQRAAGSSTCAGAVLDSSSWDESLCFCCMVRHRICCMPDDTTDMPATSRPPVLLLTWVSVTVLQQETALVRGAAEQRAFVKGAWAMGAA